MFKQYRVEVITFAVALTVSLSIFAWMEYRKPDHGLLYYLQWQAEVRNFHSGEVVLRGSSKREAVVTYVSEIRQRRAEREAVMESHIRTAGASSEEPRAATGERRGARIGRRGPGGRMENADLRNVDFSEADLSGIRLLAAFCQKANFAGARLNDARLEGTNFEESRFRNAELAESDLTNANLAGSDLAGVVARDSVFRFANFSGADLSGADFSGADLSDADMADVRYSAETRFEGATFVNTRNLSTALREFAEQSGALFHGLEEASAE